MYCILLFLLFVSINAQSSTTRSSSCIPTDLEENDLDILFIIDSSIRSSYKYKLNLISDIINDVNDVNDDDDELPINLRYGLINFNICGNKLTFEQCKQQDLLRDFVFDFTDDLNVIFSSINALKSGI